MAKAAASEDPPACSWSGFGVQGLGFRVQGSGFRVSDCSCGFLFIWFKVEALGVELGV